MDIPKTYIDKFRRAENEKSAGVPRCERDELLDMFLVKLNAENLADGYPQIAHSRVAKMLAGHTDRELYFLYQQCSRPEVRKFGGLLRSKLRG